MSREVQVRFYESRGVKFPPATHLVLMVNGAREHAEAVREEVAGVLATLGLRLSAAKTSVVHVDEGFDFLGWRIQRRRQRGTGQRFLYCPPPRRLGLRLWSGVRQSGDDRAGGGGRRGRRPGAARR